MTKYVHIFDIVFYILSYLNISSWVKADSCRFSFSTVGVASGIAVGIVPAGIVPAVTGIGEDL